MDENVFSINKGIDNEFIFSIKKQNELLPLDLNESVDIFEFRIIKLSTREVISTIDHADSNDGVITFHDSVNGQIKVVLYKEFTSTLEAVYGDRADNYYSKPMYEILVTGNSIIDGAIQFKIPAVYVS